MEIDVFAKQMLVLWCWHTIFESNQSILHETRRASNTHTHTQHMLRLIRVTYKYKIYVRVVAWKTCAVS